MVLSQLQLAYLSYLAPSLTVLQNYRITAFVNLSLLPLKYQIMEKQQHKIDNKSLKKHHRYIYWLYHLVDKIHGPRLPQPPKVTGNLKSYL